LVRFAGPSGDRWQRIILHLLFVWARVWNNRCGAGRHDECRTHQKARRTVARIKIQTRQRRGSAAATHGGGGGKKKSAVTLFFYIVFIHFFRSARARKQIPTKPMGRWYWLRTEMLVGAGKRDAIDSANDQCRRRGGYPMDGWSVRLKPREPGWPDINRSIYQNRLVGS